MRAGSSRSSIVNNRVLRFGQEVASGNGVEVSGYAFTYGTHNPHHILAEALSPTCFPPLRDFHTMFLPRLGHAPPL